MDEHAQIFQQHRGRLCGVAYRMLGSRSDAEDAVQDAYLRWHRTSIADIRSVEAWLVTVVTRLSIDWLLLVIDSAPLVVRVAAIVPRNMKSINHAL